MVAIIVSKYDYFRTPSPQLLQDRYPDTLCVCPLCFDQDLISASQVILRAISHNRSVQYAEDLPEDQRPQRCTICGRFIAYPVAAGKEQPHA